MTSRFRLAVILGLTALAGCSDSFNAGPIRYTPNAELFSKLKNEDGSPKAELQKRVEASIGKVFGPTPQKIVVPPGSGLSEGGRLLADFVIAPETGGKRQSLAFRKRDADGKLTRDLVAGDGGYALYRNHCLHCHGVTGDGNGPTAAFLWPRPRDYRKGMFKFTSTTGQKPTREDLRRTLNIGIANSSMPAFEAIMTEPQIEQVIDYVIFLSTRGETERRLIEEATIEDEPKTAQEESAINPETAGGIAQVVFESWNQAKDEVLNPPIPRTPSTPESIANGKKLFLGLGTPKLECAGCHGPKALGNGPSFVPYSMFREVVFGGDPAEQDQRLEAYIEREVDRAVEEAEQEPHGEDASAATETNLEAVRTARIEALNREWVGGSLDDWGNPLRPANINNGPATQYKGGRRPLDLYWRIAKGINGAKMPAHASLLKPEQIWDLVNFVLAMPYQPDLMDDAPETVPPATTTNATAALGSGDR